MFTADELFHGIALAEENAFIPALQRTVRVRELSLAQRYDSAERARNGETFRTATWYAWVVAYGLLREPNGARVLADADVPRLLDGRQDVIEQIAAAILTLSEARPGDLKSGDRTDDSGQLDAPAGDQAGA